MVTAKFFAFKNFENSQEKLLHYVNNQFLYLFNLVSASNSVILINIVLIIILVDVIIVIINIDS